MFDDFWGSQHLPRKHNSKPVKPTEDLSRHFGTSGARFWMGGCCWASAQRSVKSPGWAARSGIDSIGRPWMRVLMLFLEDKDRTVYTLETMFSPGVIWHVWWFVFSLVTGWWVQAFFSLILPNGWFNQQPDYCGCLQRLGGLANLHMAGWNQLLLQDYSPHRVAYATRSSFKARSGNVTESLVDQCSI